jgi:hypothetical protein
MIYLMIDRRIGAISVLRGMTSLVEMVPLRYVAIIRAVVRFEKLFKSIG